MNITMNQVLIIFGGLVLLYLLKTYSDGMYSGFTNGGSDASTAKPAKKAGDACSENDKCPEGMVCTDGKCAAAPSKSGFYGGAPTGYSADTASNLQSVDMADPNGVTAGSCYPKQQLNPSELLPNDPHSGWAQMNPQGMGDLAGKNLVDPSYFLGVNTIGQSLKNANQQIRSDPSIPSGPSFGILQSTIQADVYRKSFEIGSA
jgi:hypothetical protein